MKRNCALRMRKSKSPDIENRAAFPRTLNWRFNRSVMLSGKRIADVGYKLVSGSMMLLTVYGGYLCVLRAQRFMQRQKQLELAAQNESAASETIKD
ncbi:cytochrome c oxidase assembly protein COX14 homolog [Carassius auratus]|uniref:Cytochrome c oxidase assembly protein COX14 homolog n=1 Tax=Carassius auratus TaxID=7957 RepID=A0A6P6PI15_CARAU|nr:cytochrome c oxidase assembly protein COX14 homolog [Carassius auratus]XP_052394865.1 cytochrome c oxidase assembly protein COX14 homolog isoform X1 [Carassius gibelio]